tara:strand:+ start:63 stop:2054 length:1992 start_codon:yes stop_codon:yes gene_type:complete
MDNTKVFEYKCFDLICEQNKSLYLLLSNLLLHKTINDDYSVYDNCFGLGGIFDSIEEHNNKDSKVLYHGHEINEQLFDYYKSKKNNDNYFLHNTNSIANNMFSDLKFDYLINNPPIGFRIPKEDIENYLENNQSVIENIRRGEYIFLIDLINKSKEGSRIISLVPPNFLYSTHPETSIIRKYLFKNDMLESIVRCSEGAQPGTSIPFYILVIDRKKDQALRNKIQLFNAEKYFIECDLTDIENKIIKELHMMRNENRELYFGGFSEYKIKKRFDANRISIFLEDYLSFENSDNKIIIDVDENLDYLRFDSLFMIRDIKNNMTTGELLPFSSIVEEVRSIDLSPLKKLKNNNDIEEYLLKYKVIQDSDKDYVFFPTIPSSKTKVRNGSLRDLEKYKYISVKLKDGVDSKYVTDLYNSKTGKDFIKTVTLGQTIPFLSGNAIKDMPYIENKHFNIKMSNEITELIENLSKLADKNFDDQNVDIYTLVNDLLPGNDIRGLIKTGEGNKVEFKSTFSKPLEEPPKNVSNKELRTNLETACLKTISGFLNADGGKLLIGVMDEGKIIGVESDLHKNKDEHNLDLSQKIEARIGLAYIKYIDITYHDIDGKTVCEVTCKSLRGINPEMDIAPLKDKKSSAQSSWKYYVRSQAKTIALEGKDLLDYLKDN